jgi:spore coat protein SA
MTMSIPRVAVVTPGSFVIPSPSSSSVERVVYNTFIQMAGQAEATIYGRSSRFLPSREIRHGIRFRRFRFRSKAAYVGRISRELKKTKPDIIQVENRPRYVPYLKKRHPASQIWLSLHSTTFLSARYISPRRLMFCLRSADRLLVNSHFLREYLIRLLPETESKITVNHPGVDPAQFVSRWSLAGAARREALLAKLGLAGRKVVLYVGRLIPLKGVHHLLAAWQTVSPAVPGAVLFVVGGSGYGSNRKTAYVRRLYKMARGMGDSVRFIPYVPYSHIADWFLAADVMVVPSGKREAFGLVNVEAMASGVPVIATRAGGIPEIVHDGMTGFLVDLHQLPGQLAERLVLLLGDDELKMRMGAAGAEYVRNHLTWHHSAERLAAAYREALSGTGAN